MDPRTAAYHEAGHVVAAHRVEVPRITKVNITPGRGLLGGVWYSQAFQEFIESAPEAWERRFRMERCGIVCWSGRAAQLKFNKGSVRKWQYAYDGKMARKLMINFLMGGEEEAKVYTQLLQIRAKYLLHNQSAWRQVEAVAQELELKKSLSSSELEEILA